MTALKIVIAVGLPAAFISAVLGLLFRRLEKKIEHTADVQKEQADARLEYEVFQASMVTAVAALSKANAVALKNGKCNGETTKALEYLEEVKHDQRRFLAKHGIEHIYENL